MKYRRSLRGLLNRKKRQEIFWSVSRDHSDQLDDGFLAWVEKLMCSIWLATWLKRCSIALWRTSIWRCMSTEETRIQANLKKPAQITKCGPGFYDAFGQTSLLHPSITQQTLKKSFLGSLYNFSAASDVQFQWFILNFIRLSSVDGQKSRQSVDLVHIQNPSQTHKETVFIWAILPTAPLGVHEHFGLEGPDTKSVKHLAMVETQPVFGRPSFNSLLFICFWMIHIKIEKCHGLNSYHSYLFISKSRGYKVAIMIQVFVDGISYGLSFVQVWFG